MTLSIRWLSAVLLAVALGGCVDHTVQLMPELKRDGASELRVLIMPLDVELSELNAGGLKEPRADWTAAAEKLIRVEVEKMLKEKRAVPVAYVRPENDAAKQRLHDQLVKLHARVGQMVVLHHYLTPLKLPNKNGQFDWVLGPDAGRLREDFGADYALFLFVRDSYTSAGRAAAIVLAAVLGFHLQGGQQLGFASLVDLRTGQIVWFNILARNSGDLRTADSAGESVAQLLHNFPK